MTRNCAALLLGMCLAMAARAAPSLREAPPPMQRIQMQIERMYLGSGLQNAPGVENAQPVGNFGVWHAPQYMPGYPTAATIWPRVVNVRCMDHVCAGYVITPEMGRGEYLFFRPSDK